MHHLDGARCWYEKSELKGRYVSYQRYNAVRNMNLWRGKRSQTLKMSASHSEFRCFVLSLCSAIFLSGTRVSQAETKPQNIEMEQKSDF